MIVFLTNKLTCLNFFHFTFIVLHAEITLRAFIDEIVSPDSGNRLGSLVILTCLLEPETTQADDYESRWITPSDEILEFGAATTSTKYIVSQSRVTEIGSRQEVAATVLVIRELLYTDAGNYTCEVQNSSDSSAQWVSDIVRVLLLGKWAITLYQYALKAFNSKILILYLYVQWVCVSMRVE